MKLFTYGLLQDGDRMHNLIDRLPERENETVNGYDRVKIDDLFAIIPAPGNELRGVLYHGLKPADMAILDEFEGERYERTQIRTKNYRKAEVYKMKLTDKEIEKARNNDTPSDNSSSLSNHVNNLTASHFRQAMRSFSSNSGTIEVNGSDGSIHRVGSPDGEWQWYTDDSGE